MGALHEGHVSLVKEAKKYSDIVAVSIFVNPTQFNNPDDLKSYPVNMERDLRMLEGLCELIFAPTVKEMYPEEDKRQFDFGSLETVMEGKHRPGHFNGVAQIVSKLFDFVKPDKAFFGEKDFQQLAIIRRLVKDLKMPVEVIGCPIIREADGLAMSSRNEYLSPQERESALSLYRSLKLAEQMVKSGERNPPALIRAMRDLIESQPHVRKIDYIEIVDPETLEPLAEIKGKALIALAVWVGRARLIDNLEVEP